MRRLRRKLRKRLRNIRRRLRRRLRGRLRRNMSSNLRRRLRRNISRRLHLFKLTVRAEPCNILNTCENIKIIHRFSKYLKRRREPQTWTLKNKQKP